MLSGEKKFTIEEEELTADESELLALMLKGDFSGHLKEPEIPKREIYSPVPLSFGKWSAACYMFLLVATWE